MPDPAAQTPRAGRGPSLALAVIAVLALVALWLGSSNFRLSQENSDLRTQRDFADLAAQIAQTRLQERTLVAEGMINDLGRQLRARPDLPPLRVAVLVPPAGAALASRATVVWDPARLAGLLTVEQLPVLADGQDYQLWIFDPASPSPASGGVFRPGADGKTVLPFRGAQPVGSVTAFAISLEKQGGAPQAEGPVVLQGKL